MSCEPREPRSLLLCDLQRVEHARFHLQPSLMCLRSTCAQICDAYESDYTEVLYQVRRYSCTVSRYCTISRTTPPQLFLLTLRYILYLLTAEPHVLAQLQPQSPPNWPPQNRAATDNSCKRLQASPCCSSLALNGPLLRRHDSSWRLRYMGFSGGPLGRTSRSRASCMQAAGEPSPWVLFIAIGLF